MNSEKDDDDGAASLQPEPRALPVCPVNSASQLSVSTPREHMVIEEEVRSMT